MENDNLVFYHAKIKEEDRGSVFQIALTSLYESILDILDDKPELIDEIDKIYFEKSENRLRDYFNEK